MMKKTKHHNAMLTSMMNSLVKNTVIATSLLFSTITAHADVVKDKMAKEAAQEAYDNIQGMVSFNTEENHLPAGLTCDVTVHLEAGYISSVEIHEGSALFCKDVKKQLDNLGMTGAGVIGGYAYRTTYTNIDANSTADFGMPGEHVSAETPKEMAEVKNANGPFYECGLDDHLVINKNAAVFFGGNSYQGVYFKQPDGSYQNRNGYSVDIIIKDGTATWHSSHDGGICKIMP